MIFQQFFHRFYDPHRVITILVYLIQIASQKNQQFLRIIIIIVFIGLGKREQIVKDLDTLMKEVKKYARFDKVLVQTINGESVKK